MQLFIRGTEKIHSVDIAEAATVADLKNLLTNYENCDYYLTLNGAVLDEDEKNLSAYGVQNSNSIDLTVRLLGGKVHGSLARAGKVRGQTPKVEKKEKRKKKTGRAKRRLQYTRRFVNVVATGPGRRRGPNSNMT